MGSLTSRPKVPSVSTRQIVNSAPNITAPIITTPSVAIPVTQTSTPTTPASSDTNGEERIVISSDMARVENLLRRNRGVGGTILTGFRGLLSGNDLAPQRKKLLGE